MNTETPEKTSAGPTPGPLHAAVQEACGIIERADARNLASDIAGGQPPRMTLTEWRELYTVLDRARKADADAAPDLLAVAKETHQFLWALLDVTSKHGLLLAAEPSLAPFDGIGKRLLAAIAKAGVL